MRLRSLFVLPALAGLAFLATRAVPGRLRDGTTLLPSGWRIRPAGRTVSVGTLPLGLVTLSDGSLMVANNGYGANGLTRIDPVKGAVVWQTRLPAWLGRGPPPLRRGRRLRPPVRQRLGRFDGERVRSVRQSADPPDRYPRRPASLCARAARRGPVRRAGGGKRRRPRRSAHGQRRRAARGGPVAPRTDRQRSQRAGALARRSHAVRGHGRE